MKRFTHTVAKIKNSSGEYEPIPALRGMSSYETAVEAGYTGTEEEWLALTIRALDDGWVTKYEELEANKANKSDVYTKTDVDKQNLNNLIITKISRSMTWVAPKAVNQLFRVFCVGGGGAGGNACSAGSGDKNCGGGGGGSGRTSFKDLTITNGETVSITCGAGGVASDGGSTSFGSYITASGGKKGSDATATRCGDGGTGGAGGGGGASNYSSTTIVSGNGGDGQNVGGGGGGGASSSTQSAGTGGTHGSLLIQSSGGLVTQYPLGSGGSPYNMASSRGGMFNFPLATVLFDQSMIHPNNYGTNDNGTLYNVGSGGYGAKGGDSIGHTRNSGAGGGGGLCGNGGNARQGGGGGGGYCGNGGNSYYGGGGGGGFFCNGGDSYEAGFGYNVFGGGGGGGFFSDGKNGGYTTGGNGGDGGVLIMYIKED